MQRRDFLKSMAAAGAGTALTCEGSLLRNTAETQLPPHWGRPYKPNHPGGDNHRTDLHRQRPLHGERLLSALSLCFVRRKLCRNRKFDFPVPA